MRRFCTVSIILTLMIGISIPALGNDVKTSKIITKQIEEELSEIKYIDELRNIPKKNDDFLAEDILSKFDITSFIPLATTYEVEPNNSMSLADRIYSDDNVYGGTTIGYMGNSGASQGVHLHFETMEFVNQDTTWTQSGYVDPLTFYPNIILNSSTIQYNDKNEIDSHGDHEDDFYSLDEIEEMSQKQRDKLGIPYYE